MSILIATLPTVTSMVTEKEKAAIEDAMVEVELFMKYRLPQSASAALESVLIKFPGSTDARWKLAELYYEQQHFQKSAEQLLLISDLYANMGEKDFAHSTLQRIKQIYPECPQLEVKLAIYNQNQQPTKPEPVANSKGEPAKTLLCMAPLAGDLRDISLFDIIQALEKNDVTGVIHIYGAEANGNLYLNGGLLVNAVCGELKGKTAFKRFAEVTEGFFELEKSPVEFYAAIHSNSNAQLILEVFADSDALDMPMDEEST